MCFILHITYEKKQTMVPEWRRNPANLKRALYLRGSGSAQEAFPLFRSSGSLFKGRKLGKLWVGFAKEWRDQSRNRGQRQGGGKDGVGSRGEGCLPLLGPSPHQVSPSVGLQSMQGEGERLRTHPPFLPSLPPATPQFPQEQGC